MRLGGIHSQRAADVSCGEHSRCCLDHLVEVHPRQGHALVQDGIDLEAALNVLSEPDKGTEIICSIAMPADPAV